MTCKQFACGLSAPFSYDFVPAGDYDGGLGVFNDMVSVAEYGGKSPIGVYCDILHR